MAEVNLLKDTEGLNNKKKPVPKPTNDMALTEPGQAKGSGLGGAFRSVFSRRPKPLPVAAPAPSPVQPQPAPPPAVPPPPPMPTPVKAPDHFGKMSLGTDRLSNQPVERILSEKKTRGAAMIPLPEDLDIGHDVNLLSEELISTVNPRQRLILLGIIALITLAVIGAAFGELTIYQNGIERDIASTQDQLTAVKARISSLGQEQKQVLATSQKLEAIKTLIDKHTRWTKFFRLLEKYTLPSVTYGPSFSADTSGAITLSASTPAMKKSPASTWFSSS